MKLSTSLMLSLSLISSCASATWFSMPSWINYNTVGVACLGAIGLRLHFKKGLTQDQLDTKRSIMDEKSLPEASTRLIEEFIGQNEDEKKDIPATGCGWAKKMVTKNILPLTGTLVLMDKTRKKIVGGLKSFGLDSLIPFIPTIPTME